MLLTRDILQEMMLPTTQDVDTLRDLINSRVSTCAGIGLSEIKLSMSNLQALVADLDQYRVPFDKVPAAVSIVLTEYLDNKIRVNLLFNCEKEMTDFDPSDDLSDRGLTIHISWGPT